MNSRIQQFLQAENLSQSQFAETLGVTRASISHIISGRNKPGFDFIESMALHYPSLNLDWLITGNGQMYKGSPVKSEIVSNAPEQLNLLFSQPDNESMSESPIDQPVIEEKSIVESPVLKTIERKSDTKVDKFIVFYSDGTYQEFLPTRK